MNLNITFSEKQFKADRFLMDESIRFLLYGGAKGGGKSVFGVYWIVLKAVECIKRFNIPASKTPLPIGFVGRRRGVDFNDTTLETFKRFIPSGLYNIRENDKEIVIANRVKYTYGGFDDDSNVKKFNSAEYAYFFIDQAEEISRDDFGLLCGTLRLTYNNVPIEPKGLLTANPSHCWLKDEFILNKQKGYAFIQALPTDNPYLPQDYVATLTEAFKHRPEFIEAYVKGSWDIIAGSDLVIKPSWVEVSVKRDLKIPIKKKRAIACDPARFGDDETVIYVLEDNRIIDQLIFGKKDTMYTTGHLMRLRNKYDVPIIAVDVIGIGAGIVDRLNETRPHRAGYVILAIDSAKSPTDAVSKKRYYNLRSQMWWQASDLFAEGQVSIPDDPVLKRQLMNVRYLPPDSSGGRIKIESKNNIKKDMSGQSPDRADALIMGLYALGFVSEKPRDFFREQPVRRRNDYGWNRGVSPNIPRRYY